MYIYHNTLSDCLDSDSFVTSVTSSVTAMGWHTKAKYKPLTCLVKILGADYFLRRDPDLAAAMLQMMSDQTLACYVSGIVDLTVM